MRHRKVDYVLITIITNSTWKSEPKKKQNIFPYYPKVRIIILLWNSNIKLLDEPIFIYFLLPTKKRIVSFF